MKLKKHILLALLVISTLAILYYVSTIKYLVFHTFINLAGTVVAITIFIIGWNTRKYSDNPFMVILAAGYLVVGIITIFHTLSFKGMGVFPEYGENLPAQLLIASRYVESFTILIAASYLGEKKDVNASVSLAAFLSVGLVIGFSIFKGFFPDCIIDGSVLTSFKVISEYIICGILLLSGYIFWKRRNQLERDILIFILCAIALSIIVQLSDTLNVDPYGFVDRFGDFIMFVSLLFIYFSFIQGSLTRPYELLFNNINRYTEKLVQNNREYKIILQTAIDGFWITDISGAFLDVNNAYCEMSGYSREELLLMKIFDVEAIESSEQNAEHRRELIEAGYLRFDTKHRRKDNTIIDVQVSAQYSSDIMSGVFIVFIQNITEKKIAERELQKLALAVEGSPISVVITDKEGNIEYTNPKFTDISGFLPEEVLGKNPRILNSGTQPPKVYQDLWNTINAGKEWRGNFCNINKNGDYYWESAYISPIFNDKKQITHFVGLKEDITKSMRTESIQAARSKVLEKFSTASSFDEIRSATMQYVKQIFPQHPASILLLDESGQHLKYAASIGLPDYYNKAVDGLKIGPNVGSCGAAAYLAERVIVEDIETHPNWAPFLELTQKVGIGACWSEPILSSTGKVLGTFALYSMHPSRPEEENLQFLEDAARLFGIVLERKLSEEALSRNEENLRLLLDSSAEAIYGTDLDGNCTFCNPSCLKLLGYTSTEEVIGKNMHSLIHYKCSDGTPFPIEECQIFKALQNGEKIHLNDEVFWRKDGKCFPVEVWAYPQKRDKRLVGSVVNFIDITERQQIAEELISAKEQAEAANRAKSIFLANMSHEIRTPLNAILGFPQLMMRDSNLTEHQKQHLNIINHSGEHLLSLINDILELSKIEAGRVNLNPQVFGLNALVLDTEKMFKLRTSEKNLSFNVEYTGIKHQYIEADENRLKQIFINLLGNAVKFTQKGGITWRVKTEEDDTGNLVLVSEVEDTGQGIAHEDMDRLFAVFEQLNTTSKTEGTGLGLAISRQLARQMEGDITVRSEKGRGSSFRLQVRIKPGNVGYLSRPIKYRRIKRLRVFHSPFKILVADDNYENRMLLNELLLEAGFEISNASNGLEAISVFEEWNPSLILMDLWMPEMDGAEAAKRIKATDKGSNTPIIFVTADIFEDQKNMDVKGQGYIQKPFKEQELFEAIGACLGDIFEYEDQALSEAGKDLKYNPEVLSEVPGKILQEMRNAVITGNADELFEMLNKLSRAYPQAVELLRKLAEDYRFDELLELLK